MDKKKDTSIAAKETENKKLVAGDTKEEPIPKELQPILQNIPKPQQQKIVKLIQGISIQQRTFSGPVPSPDILIGYNDVVKDGGERIIAMAERQSSHRIELESFAVKAGFTQSGHGQIYGFILGLAALIGAIYLGIQGHDVLAGTIATTTIGSFLAAFVFGNKRQATNKQGNSE